MFKKIVSILIAAMMVTSMAAVAVSAAESDAAVGAASDNESVGAASDNESVGADDSASAEVGAGKSINFKVDKSLWKNFKVITCYLYEHGGDEIITWGSKKGNMDDAGNDVWTFDFDKKGIELESGKQYGCIFTGDWGVQTCDLILDSTCIGHTASLTGDQVENNVDSNKKSYVVQWDGLDTSKYAPPKCITSIGNVIGSAYWADSSPYKLLVSFIKSNDKDGLSNAIKFNGKDEQKTLDDTAKALGLTADDIEKAIKEAGKTVKWDKAKSTAGGSSSGGSSSSDDSSSNGDSGNNNSGSNNSSGSSSSGSSSSGSSSVSSGQETTIFFVFGGVMLAAAGVIFLARKRRDF